MSHDQKVIMLLPPMEKCAMDFYQRVVFTAKFDNSSPSVTGDKEICHMASLPPEAEYSMEPFG